MFMRCCNGCPQRSPLCRLSGQWFNRMIEADMKLFSVCSHASGMLTVGGEAITPQVSESFPPAKQAPAVFSCLSVLI